MPDHVSDNIFLGQFFSVKIHKFDHQIIVSNFIMECCRFRQLYFIVDNGVFVVAVHDDVVWAAAHCHALHCV
jgi:hypothetical protein